WKVYFKIKKMSPDIVHTHLVGFFYSALSVITSPLKRFFYSVHSPADKDVPYYYRPVYKFLFKFFNVKTIPISQAVQKSFKQVYNLNSGQVIYHGTKMNPDGLADGRVTKEVSEYKNTPSTHIFITLARIAEEKNQQLLIESFNRLILEKLDVVLLIIGNGTKNALLNELKILAGPNIYFLGAKDDTGEYLKLADAFCLTSEYEGLSLATIEALAMKVIPICTSVGGIPEVVQDGYNGILSADCTVISYFKALKRFLVMTDEKKQAMRENAFRTYKERFTIERCGNEYLKLYKDAL
ncbi:MAG: glycosyltransferase family 4 protein, partial [Chitinophagaceae bacterium]